MKEHAQKMVKFASSLKALMYVCDLDTTDDVTEFIHSENPATLKPMFFHRLTKLAFEDGFFRDNLRHCTCSEVQFDDEKTEVKLN